MKMRKQTVWLILAGSLFNGLGFLSQRLFETPDFVRGLIQGIGIGLLLLALLNDRKYKIQNK